jgi:hypothetical protein
MMIARSNETKAFLFSHVFFLCIVLVGFGRTFYLRSVFIAQPLPAVLLMHGVALTLWYGIVVLQAALMANASRGWHRRLSWLVIPVVAAVIISGITVNMRVALTIASARSPENMFVWGNFMTLLSFLVLVSAAVALRRRPAAHYRLIFFASIAIIGPAFARFAFWPAIGLGLSAAPMFAMAGMMILVLLAMSYDVAMFRRVQAATLAGLAGVLIPLVAGTAVAMSGIGFALLH